MHSNFYKILDSLKRGEGSKIKMVPYNLYRSKKQMNILEDLPESQVQYLGVGF